MTDQAVSVLPTTQLQPNPFQPRGKIAPDDVKELVESIKTYGILEPIVVAQTPAGYQIIAGERRWRAARELNLETVPVIVKKTTPRGMLEMAIVENVQRVDLSPVERAQAFQQLIRDFHFTHADIAEKIGKSSSYISNSIKLLTLPDAIKDGLVGGLISEGHARALFGIADEKAMVECYKVILKENGSVRRAEELARRFKEQIGQPHETRGRGNHLQSEKVDEWISQLQQVFHKNAKVKLVRSNAQTRVTIVLKGDPEQTQADLEKILTLAKEN
jgi:ParB family chromosome partitioning protein